MCPVLPSAAGEPWGPGNGASPLVFFHLPHREAGTLVVNWPFQAEPGTGVPKQEQGRFLREAATTTHWSPFSWCFLWRVRRGPPFLSLAMPTQTSREGSRIELSLARRHFWDAGSRFAAFQQVAFEHFQLWFTLPPGCFSPLVCPGSWLPGGQAVVGAEPFLPLDLEGLNVLDKQLGGRARLRRGG